MKNPNQNIRIAHIKAFEPIGLKVWAKKVPKDVVPVPNQYILITSQSKRTFADDKDGHEWLCTIVIDIVSVIESGFSSPKTLDFYEEQILGIIENEIPIEDFINKEVTLVDSTDLDSETQTQSIERRVLTYQYWVNNVD